MLTGYIQKVLTSYCGNDYCIIPLNCCPSIFHEIEFKGWKGISLSYQDETLNEMVCLASQTAAIFINFYKEKYAFTEPQFCLPCDGKSCIIKIGMMDIEIYNELLERANNKKKTCESQSTPC